ncbi:MAG TPA: hypothetical protein VF364_07390, partial [Candidatus Limnocylindria bacterium]
TAGTLETIDDGHSWWLPPALALSAMIVLSGLVYLLWPSLPKARTRRAKPDAVPRTPPESVSPEPDWVALLPVLMPHGQLRLTLRHRENLADPDRELFFQGAEVELDGPDGAFTLVRADPPSGFWRGVYFAHYPRDFDAPPLKPGQYCVQWFGKNLTGRRDPEGRDDLEYGDRFLVRATRFEVHRDCSVRPLG